jgi:glutamine amidotransferase
MTGRSKIFLIDVGIGNIRSVQKALEISGANVIVSNLPEKLLAASKAVLPGVGAFGDFMRRLEGFNLSNAIKGFIESGRPLLGICVGMQALFDSSSEYGNHSGLGVIHGSVSRFPAHDHLKIPQTGWNQIEFSPENPLFAGLPAGVYAYFNHAYYCTPLNPEHTISHTTYGIRYTSAVGLSNLWGVQFHPEKSQEVGLKVLKNFVEMTL